MSLHAQLTALLAEAGDAALVDALARYGELVLDANRKFNLTGAKTPEEFAPHIIDSLSVAPYVEKSLVDVGSGGGLPAIPLAIATRVPVTMVETTVKKANFLRGVLADLGLEGTVVAERAEVAGHDDTLRGRFFTGTARAVSGAPTVAELLLPLIEPGGKAVLQRGTIDDRERRALEDAALVLGAEFQDEFMLDGERRIIVLRKTGPTQPRFPRRIGIPEKRPLCF